MDETNLLKRRREILSFHTFSQDSGVILKNRKQWKSCKNIKTFPLLFVHDGEMRISQWRIPLIKTVWIQFSCLLYGLLLLEGIFIVVFNV